MTSFPLKKEETKEEEKKEKKKINSCVHNNCQPVLSALSVCYPQAVCIYTLLSVLHLSSSFLKNCPVVSNIHVLER